MLSILSLQEIKNDEPNEHPCLQAANTTTQSQQIQTDANFKSKYTEPKQTKFSISSTGPNMQNKFQITYKLQTKFPIELNQIPD